MQEWIFAMLVISVLLVLRDMAKTILAAKNKSTEESIPCCDRHPQKEKAEKYAASFQKLADTFYGMPYRKEYLSNGQIDRIRTDVQEQVCFYCFQKELCWKTNQWDMENHAEILIRAMEDGTSERVGELKKEWSGFCVRTVAFMESVNQIFQKEQQSLIWTNRIIENRLAVAQQLTETARIMKEMANDLYEMEQAAPAFYDELKKRLKKRQVVLKHVWVMDKTEGRRQIFLTIRARSGQCISMLEVAQVLSEVCNASMTPADGSRCIVNGEFHTVHFVEDAIYQVLYGVARITRENERVSGDNYVFHQEEGGKFVMCLSDGMGSGIEAYRESEIVVDLLEQFLDSGFSEETSIRMVNSALILNGREGMFSTVDLCAVDLYSGICSLLKAGASATFIRRDHWVETIESESLAAGIVQQLDYETASRKLYHGDYLIMMSDGVLDALPLERQEETMKEIILDVKEDAPKEIGRGILERVLGYSDYCAQDDMTVLVAGIWKK